MMFVSKSILVVAMSCVVAALATPGAPSWGARDAWAVERARAFRSATPHSKRLRPTPRVGEKCKQLQAESARLVPFISSGGGDFAGDGDVAKLMSTCVATPKGAWALRLLEPPVEERSLAPRACVALVHVSTAGETTECVLPPIGAGFGTVGCASTADCLSDLFGAWFSIRVVADYDGDGEDEVFVNASYAFEGGDRGWSSLLSFRGKTIGALPESRSLPYFEAKDVDHDGIEDLVFFPFISMYSNPCTPTSDRIYSEFGVRYVAHARHDGSFSLDDAVARSFVRRQCPKPPRDLAHSAACAIAWGAPQALVLEHVQRRHDRCSASANVDPLDARFCGNDLRGEEEDPCADRVDQVGRAFSRVTPPFTLR